MHKLMVDSGAFSVWNRGRSIDLGEYIAFCKEHSDASYYVNLDVIPGKPHDKSSINPRETERACNLGWDNYQKMLEHLPKEKVIPVYHMGDNLNWLHKYIKFGTPYIGISPANDKTTDQKMRWMEGLRPILFGKSDVPVLHLHGFAVTSFRLMKFWRWHSVDSASWRIAAGWGKIWWPRTGPDGWDYSATPKTYSLSPIPVKQAKSIAHGVHSFGLNLEVSSNSSETRLLKRYLEEIGIPWGKCEIVQNFEGKRPKVKHEIWYDKKRKMILRIVEPGAVAQWEYRALANIHMLSSALPFLPVDNMYYAGAATGSGDVMAGIEAKLDRRLLSYEELRKGSGMNIFQFHLDKIKNEKRSRDASRQPKRTTTGTGSSSSRPVPRRVNPAV